MGGSRLMTMWQLLSMSKNWPSSTKAASQPIFSFIEEKEFVLIRAYSLFLSTFREQFLKQTATLMLKEQPMRTKNSTSSSRLKEKLIS